MVKTSQVLWFRLRLRSHQSPVPVLIKIRQLVIHGSQVQEIVEVQRCRFYSVDQEMLVNEQRISASSQHWFLGFSQRSSSN